MTGEQLPPIKDILEQPTLEEVHKKINKYLFLCDDTLIDVILAVYLCCQKFGTKVWVFIVDNSGESKTELLKPLLQFKNSLLIDDITIAGITSGKAVSQDLFGKICNDNKNFLVILDVASLSSKKRDEKNAIWAKFRNLYDGVLSKVTGNFSKETLNGYVGMIGGATKDFRSQYIINQQLGSRELLFTPKQRPEDLAKKLDKAMENDDYEEQMRGEIQDVMYRFLQGRKLKKIDWDFENEHKDFNDFLNEQVKRIRILRASAEVNYYMGAIVGEINIEMPARVKKQFKRLTEGLLSLDDSYNMNRVKGIIRNMVNSSGNQLRRQIIDYYDKNPNETYSIADISQETKTHKKLVTIQLDFLWKLEWLNRVTRVEHYCGRDIEVHYYNRNIIQLEV